MAKGYQGQSCAEAIKNCFSGEETLSYSQILAEVRKQGAWKDITIWRHLMSTVANLIPAQYEWSNAKYLFLRPDGQYELFNSKRHPKPIE